MANRVTWLPSTDADIASYLVETAPAATGAWTSVGTVVHLLTNPAVFDVASGSFFLVHAAGAASSWYRITATDAAAQSTVGVPFLAGRTSSSLTTSSLDVVRMALAEIGETTTVASLIAPTTKGEQLAVLFYERTRDRLLTKHNWSWATRRADLVQLADHVRAGWSYVYALPADLLRVIALDLGYRASGAGPSLGAPTYRDPSLPVTAQGQRAPWAIEANNLATGRVLCCDLPPTPALVYAAQIVDPSLWSHAFTDAVVWALASRLAMPMSVKPELAQGIVVMAAQALAEALTADVNEQQPDPIPPSDYIAVRGW